MKPSTTANSSIHASNTFLPLPLSSWGSRGRCVTAVAVFMEATVSPHKQKTFRRRGKAFVGLPGLEPGKAGPESAVLPLHHIPMLFRFISVLRCKVTSFLSTYKIFALFFLFATCFFLVFIQFQVWRQGYIVWAVMIRGRYVTTCLTWQTGHIGSKTLDPNQPSWPVSRKSCCCSILIWF